MNYISNNLKSDFSVNELITVHYFCYSKDFTYPGECHDFYELAFIDSGRVIINYGTEEYVLSQGEAFLHDKNVFHNIRPDGNFANIAIISFNGDSLPLAKNKVLKFNENEKQLMNVILSEAKRSFMEPLNIVFLEKMTPVENSPFAWQHVIKNCLELLLISLFRNLSGEKKENIFEDKKILSENIIWFLKKNTGSKITLKQVADSVGYSLAYIKRIFKDINGTSIINYFLELKILEAKKLISEGIYTFSIIAEMLAFDSEQYFSRQFKKYTNMTPSQYKNSVKLLKIL